MLRATDGPDLRGRLLAALIVTFAVLLIDARFGAGDLFAPLELQTLDWRFRMRGREPPAGDVVLILADDATVAELGAWPPPRTVLATAIDRLAAAGAGLIVFNLLLTEGQDTMPAATQELLAATLAELPSHARPLRQRVVAALAESGPDRSLVGAITRAPPVLLPYAFVQVPAQANTVAVPDWIEPSAYRLRTRVVGDAAPAAFQPRGLIVPAPALGNVAATAGHVSLLLEADGSLRADLPAVAYGDEVYPSLAVEAARLQLGIPPEQMVVEGGHGVRIGQRLLAVDGSGRQLIDHYGPEGTLPTHALRNLLQGRIDPAVLAGRIVVLGASASGAGDRFTTPFSTRLPGSEHLATAIDNILSDRVLRREPSTRDMDRLLTAVMALAAALLAGRRAPWLSLLAMAGLLATLAGLLQLAFVAERVWLAALPPAAALLAAGVAVESLRLADERRRRRRLERQRANLARYFPPAVVTRLAANDAPAGLDRTQDAVVMFVDIIGFTRLSEGMAPADAMALLRGFHTVVERAVFDHGGMVDKFMGDGAMACFGVPDPAVTAAADAIRAALALLAELAAMDGPRLNVGIGVHLGPVLMGDIGGATQFQFTVIGDTVNVASRLESLTRQQATTLIVSDRVLDAARAHLDPAQLQCFEPLYGLAIRGRENTLDAWRLATRPEPASSLVVETMDGRPHATATSAARSS
jgi:adenylate cyclase